MCKLPNKITLQKTALLFLGCIVLGSCNNSKIIPIIDLNKIDQSITLDLTDILKDISHIQISTDFLFSVNDEVYVTPQYLVIYGGKYSEGASLDLFSRTGEHIRKLAARGNGPGEFYSIEDFFVDEEDILYYKDMRYRDRLFRIDLANSGAALEPLQVDFTYLTTKYLNKKIYSFPNYRGSFTSVNDYPDSAIVAQSTSMPLGETKKFKGGHTYQYLVLGSSITSYYDEISLINLGYSDTLFTLKNDKLSPLCVLKQSNKMTDFSKGGNVIQMISAYQNGIVLSKIKVEYRESERAQNLTYLFEYFMLYDRKGTICKIDNTHVLNTNINLTDPEKNYPISSLLPVTCGKYGYMLVEHDILENQPANFDPDNDNPILIVGTLK